MLIRFYLPFIFLLAHTSSIWAQPYSFGTSQSGGALYVTALAVSQSAAKLTGADMRVIPHSSTTVVMSATNAGKTDFGMASAAELEMGKLGDGFFKGNSMENIVAVGNLYPFQFTMVARAGIDANDISDLVGKRLPSAFKKTAVGLPYYTAILAASGISYDDVDTMPVNTFVQARDAFSAGKVDAAQYIMDTPFLEQMTASVGPLRFLSIAYDSESEARAQEINPALRVARIPVAPEYAGDEDHIYVLEYDYMIYTHKDMPDDIVEKMAMTLVDGVEEMTKSVRAFENMDVSKVGQSNSIPFHPAAIKLYQARGLIVSSK